MQKGTANLAKQFSYIHQKCCTCLNFRLSFEATETKLIFKMGSYKPYRTQHKKQNTKNRTQHKTHNTQQYTTHTIHTAHTKYTKHNTPIYIAVQHKE